MVESWTEFHIFKATNQTLADQVRTIGKNGWPFDLKILKIHKQKNIQTHQQTTNTITETINT